MNIDLINALPGDWQIDFAAPHPVDVLTDFEQSLRDALAEPLASSTLVELCASSRNIAIVCDTSLDPDLLQRLLKGTLIHLQQADMQVNPVQLLLPFDTTDTIRQALADLNLPIIYHDPDDLRESDTLGMVAGLPLLSNFHAINADLLISVGAVQTDLFAGYSGGSEETAFGMSGRMFQRGLREIHFLSEQEIHADPVRNRNYQRVVREAARRVGLRFVVNVLLDQQKRVVAIRAGEPNTVHDTLISLSRTQREASVRRDDYDVIVADKPYGYASLYEASAVPINIAGASMSPLMQGGVIMLSAQCGTDLSSLQSEISQRFYDAMTAGRDTEMVMAMLKQRVLLPGEDRAYLLAQSMQHYKVMVVSPDEACERLARACHFIAVRDMTEAVDLAESLVGGRPNALVLSDAHYTLPVYSPAMQYASQQTRDDALNLTWLDGLDDIDVEKLLDASDAE